MRSMIDSLLKSVNKISEINKRIQTYSYKTNAFKICESEMLSKNKLNRLDENKNTPKDKTICIINIKDKNKTKSECEDKNRLVMVYSDEEMEVIKGDEWIRRKILLVFWNNNNNNYYYYYYYISKLCENWAFFKDNYIYTRFEELCTCSSEALYTREHKATLSKKKHMQVCRY